MAAASDVRRKADQRPAVQRVEFEAGYGPLVIMLWQSRSCPGLALVANGC